MNFGKEEKNVLKLENENRKLKNQMLDTEFQAAEMEIQNSLLNDEISTILGQKTEKSTNKSAAQVVELRSRLASIRHKSRDSEIFTKNLEKSLQNRKLDLSFLKIELAELEKANASDSYEKLKLQLSQKKEEIESNKQMLDVLEREETLVKSRATELKQTLGITGAIKPSSQGSWNDEKTLRERLMNARLNADKTRGALQKVENELKALKEDNSYGTNDAKGLARAISAELNYVRRSSEREVDSAYAAEKALADELKAELESVRKTTQAIKSYREKCYERQKKQYDISVSQQWLEALQKQLDSN